MEVAEYNQHNDMYIRTNKLDWGHVRMHQLQMLLAHCSGMRECNTTWQADDMLGPQVPVGDLGVRVSNSKSWRIDEIVKTMVLQGKWLQTL